MIVEGYPFINVGWMLKEAIPGISVVPQVPMTLNLVDPNGKVRGNDGVWDRGAYEFN